MTYTFIPGVVPPATRSEPALWFAFSGNQLLVYDDQQPRLIPQLNDFSLLGLTVEQEYYLGSLDGQPCFAIALGPETSPPLSMRFEGLRPLFMRMDEACIALSGRAVQIVDWGRNHQFCGRCGVKTETLTQERGKKCPACGLTSYPRLSPSIIVRVRRGDEILLARGPQWVPGFYSVIAGFVEPGETLEQTVAREVMEEVGIQVKNIQYFGSQPWPFPNSLMLGFTADYAGGELQPDENEIEDAGWFSVGNLPKIPPKISIARRLIDDFILGQG